MNMHVEDARLILGPNQARHRQQQQSQQQSMFHPEPPFEYFEGRQCARPLSREQESQEDL
jgi:hypothetical protein